LPCFALSSHGLVSARSTSFASAAGKIVPGDRTKLVQPFESGVVRAIRVHDGQSVKAGEVLIELDPTISEAELEHLRSDLLSAQLDVSRLRAALAGRTDRLEDPPEQADPALVQMHLEFLTSLHNENVTKLSEIDRQKSQKEAERFTILGMLEKTEKLIPILQERVDVRKYLSEKELGSKLQYLTDLQELVGLQQDFRVQRNRYEEAQAAVDVIAETRKKVVSEYRRQLLEDLLKASQKAADLRQDVLKAQRRTNLQVLTAPITGMVQQLSVHTVGGVVTPAQTLAVIVPTDGPIEIEAMVSNRDIGFVHAGQDVAIKVDTFNFTRYGLLRGKVLSVSPDSIVHDRLEGPDRFGRAVPDTSEPKGQELLYVAHVSLDRTNIQIEDKQIDLFPGMAVTAEIKTGSRTIISYLLSPLLRYAQESFRER
jgi:hemolysin D